MLLGLRADHKKHVSFLIEQPTHVLQDFCKSALDYLLNGPNFKLYNAAAQKLETTPEDIRNTVDGLVNLLAESCKSKLSVDDFRDTITALGFSGENETLLTKLYGAKKSEISEVLSTIGVKLPKYENMEWRFEAQIASRSSSNQIMPLITMDFSVQNEISNEVDHLLLQTDPNNLLHITEVLEQALQDGRSQHLRKIARSIK